MEICYETYSMNKWELCPFLFLINKIKLNEMIALHVANMLLRYELNKDLSSSEELLRLDGASRPVACWSSLVTMLLPNCTSLMVQIATVPRSWCVGHALLDNPTLQHPGAREVYC